MSGNTLRTKILKRMVGSSLKQKANTQFGCWAFDGVRGTAANAH